MPTASAAPSNRWEISSIAFVGAGAMGGMYAAHFRSAGFPVTFVANGARASALARDGLVVNEVPLDAHVFDAALGEAIEPADLVVVSVKHHHLDAAIDDMAGIVGPDTVILSVLNGLDSEVRLAERFGEERVLLCIAFAMDAMREANNVRYTQAGRLVFGASTGAASDPRVLAIQRALDRAGLAWQTPPDVRREMWWKFMVNVGVNQASAVLRAPYGAFVADGHPKSLCDALMREVIAVANAEGVDLGEGDLERWYRVVAAQPPNGKTSMHQDVEAGRRTEVDIFAERVVALGQQHAIATPFNEAMAWIIPELTSR